MPQNQTKPETIYYLSVMMTGCYIQTCSFVNVLIFSLFFFCFFLDPIPHDLVSLPCQKLCIRLNDIVHTKTLSTAELSKSKSLPKKLKKNSTPKAPTQVTNDSLNQKISSENSCTVTENETCEPDKTKNDSETAVAELPLSKSSEKPTNSSETCSISEFPKVQNSDVSTKSLKTRNSLASKISEPKLFHSSKLPYTHQLVNQLSVSPWNLTEVPEFKPVPSPGNYSDLCSEFKLFMCKNDGEVRDDFQSVLPLPSSSDLSLKGGVCKTLDAYYKKVFRVLLNDVPEEESNISLQTPSVEKVNDISSNSEQKDCAHNSLKMNDEGKESLKTNHESLEIEDHLKLETEKNQNENNPLARSKENFSDNKEAKKYYRHLFRRDEEEYFVPDYLPYQVGNENSQPKNSQSKTADKKALQKSLPQQGRKSRKLSADKELSKNSNTVTKDMNDKVLRDQTQSLSLTSHRNTKYTQKYSEHETLDDDSSSESEEFSDSSTSSSISESSSFFSDSDSSFESSSGEERTDNPCGYPLMYSQYPYPYSWTEGYPIRAPMYPNPYWTYPNYYYGYTVPFTQPRPDPQVTTDLYSTMKSLSHHYYQQQQNYIKWMTKSFLTQKQ